MPTKTINISLPLNLYDFLQENESLSASKVMQGALINIMNSLKTNPQLIEANKLIEQMKKSRQAIEKEQQNAAAFIEEKGMWKEYTEKYKFKFS